MTLSYLLLIYFPKFDSLTVSGMVLCVNLGPKCQNLSVSKLWVWWAILGSQSGWLGWVKLLVGWVKVGSQSVDKVGQTKQPLRG